MRRLELVGCLREKEMKDGTIWKAITNIRIIRYIFQWLEKEQPKAENKSFQLNQKCPS